MEQIKRTRNLGAITKSVTHKQSGAVVASNNTTDHIPVDDLGEHPGHVAIKGGITKNCGDYNSISVQVMISMPCEATIAAAKAKYTELSDVVDELLQNELKLALGGDAPTPQV